MRAFAQSRTLGLLGAKVKGAGARPGAGTGPGRGAEGGGSWRDWARAGVGKKCPT